MTQEHHNSADPWTRQAASTPPQQPVAGVPEQWIQAWAREVLLEQRRARRSRMLGGLFRGLFVLFIFLLAFGSTHSLMKPVSNPAASQPHLAVVELNGVIDASSQASAERVLSGVRRAFEAENARAVALHINSPGGSAVQAGQIHDGILQLREQYPDKPVYAVISDLGASGGYYVAVAAQEILADRASLVGSIGVISGGFGFAEAIERLGIERRVYAAGENKAFLDAFSTVDASQRAFWQTVLDSTHQQFIQRVRAGRGDRLADDPQLFSGLIWNGEQALQQGLIDQLGSIHSLQMQLDLQHKVNYTPEPSPWERIERHLGTLVKSTLIELSLLHY